MRSVALGIVAAMTSLSIAAAPLAAQAAASQPPPPLTVDRVQADIQHVDYVGQEALVGLPPTFWPSIAVAVGVPLVTVVAVGTLPVAAMAVSAAAVGVMVVSMIYYPVHGNTLLDRVDDANRALGAGAPLADVEAILHGKSPSDGANAARGASSSGAPTSSPASASASANDGFHH